MGAGDCWNRLSPGCQCRFVCMHVVVFPVTVLHDPTLSRTAKTNEVVGFCRGCTDGNTRKGAPRTRSRERQGCLLIVYARSLHPVRGMM